MAGEKVGSIYYDLDLDDKKFKGKANKASDEVDGLKSRLEATQGASLALAGALGGLALGLVGVAGAGLKTYAQLESARGGFVALLGSAEKADKVIARIKREAAATPFEMTGLIEGAQALTAITKDGDKAINVLMDVGKAIATSGKGQAELNSVIANLQQIAATGQITAMDIRQFQRAIPIFDDILRASGLTTEKLLKSKDAAKLLFGAFEKAGKKGGITAKGFEAQAGTLNQLYSNLVDSVVIFTSFLVENTGIVQMSKDAMAFLTEQMTNLQAAIDQAGGTQAYLTKLFNDNQIAVYAVAGALVVALIPAIVALISSLGPLGLLLIVGGMLGTALYYVVQQFGGWDALIKIVTTSLTALWNMIAPILLPTLEYLSNLFYMQILPALFQFWNMFVTFIIPALVRMWEILVTSILPDLQNLWSTIEKELLPALMELWVMVQPYLIPALKVLAVIIGVILIAGFYLLIGIIKAVIFIFVSLIQVISAVAKFIKQWFEDRAKEWRILETDIRNALAGVPETIKKPFREAFEWITKKVDEVRKAFVDLFDFTTRHSPSILDHIRYGTGKVQDFYQGMYANIDTMTAENRLGLVDSVRSAGMQQAAPVNGPTYVTINPSGIIARSRSELRDIANDMLVAVNEGLKANGSNTLPTL